ncbi:MAG: hypothetical protein IT560_13480 [Alphaproteobacteria bacterium]|nr:hypothetical protein [Alphaproteobacteria bacterium]
MNFQKTLYTLIVAIFLLSTPAQAQNKEQDIVCGGFKPAWTACTRNDDCMTGRGYCREPLAHARGASSEIAAYNQCMLRISVCISVNHDMPKVPPVCAAGRCVAGTPTPTVPGQK